MQILVKSLAIAALATFMSNAWGQEPGNPVEWQLGFGYAAGGDELADITFEGGDTQTLRAGAGLTFYVGFLNTFDNRPLALQGTVGYLVDDTTATNSKARMSRYPVDLVLFYRNEEHRFGGGLTYHMSPTLEMDNLGEKFDFDDAAGFLLEYGYSMFSVRYTNIEYSLAGSSGSVDGSSLGLHMTMSF